MHLKGSKRMKKMIQACVIHLGNKSSNAFILIGFRQHQVAYAQESSGK